MKPKRFGVFSASLLSATFVFVACDNGSGGGFGDGGPNGTLQPTDDPRFYHDDEPTTATTIGAPCSECTGKNQTCFGEDAGFTGGYCTQQCESTDQCPAGSVCTAAYSAVASVHQCYRTCSPLSICRVGYDCSEELFGLPTCRPGYVPPDPPLPRDTPGCASAMGVGGAVASSALSDALAYATSVALAVDAPRNRVVAAWSHYGTYREMGARIATSTDGGATFPSAWGSWESDDWVHISHPAARSVAATVDADGNFWVAWSERLWPIRQSIWLGSYHLAHSTDGVTWPETGLSGYNQQLDGISLTVHPMTRVPWLVAVDGVPGSRILLETDPTLAAPARGNFVTIATAPADAVRVDHPVLAFRSDGAAAIAWVVIRSNPLGGVENQIWVQRLTSEGALAGDAILVSEGDSPVRDRPSIAFVGDQLLVVYTSGSPLGDWQLRGAIARDAATGGVSASVRVDPESACSLALHPTLTVEGDSAYVTYYRAIGADGGVYRTRITNGLPSTTSRVAGPFEFQLARGGAEISPRLGAVTVGGKHYSAWTQPDATSKHATLHFASESLSE